MRTTVSIDDRLLERTKQRAAIEGTTMGSLVERSLQEYLARAQRPSHLPDLAFPTVAGQWIAPVDPSSNRELFDYLDQVEQVDLA